MKKVKDSRKRWKQLVTMLLVTALLVTGTPDIVGLASEGTQEQITTAADQSEGTQAEGQAEGQAEAAQEEEAISEEPVEQQDTSAQQDTAAKQENTENRSTAGTTERSGNSQNSHEKDKAASGAKSGGSSTSKVRETEKNNKNNKNKEDKDTKTEYTYRGSAIQAKVTLKDAEDLSDEADLRVKQTTVANKIKTQIINKAVGEENTQLVESVKAYDLSFILNGESVTPSGSMQVTLANLGTKSGQNTLIYQVTDDGQVKNTDAVQTGSDAMQFVTKSLCTYVVLTYTTVSDVNGNDITTLYPAMLTAAQTQLESKEDGNVPVESWTRTKTPLVLKDTTGKKALAWTWSDIAGIDLSLDNDSQIWNGSRSYGKHTSTSLKNGRVTAKSGKLYDSALWKNEGKAGKDTTITRIRGEFTITDKNKNNYAYTLKPVTDSENIYAKDNMFVFVYPKNVELTDDNYMDYLAFWTGSLADAGEKERTFHGRTASNYTQRTPAENVSVLTDGWHMTAACNNAGSIITSTDASDYYVDVISTTDSSNGGMYRFKLVKEKKEKTQFTFRNLDTNAKTGKGGAVFELYKDGVHYSAQSEDEEGRVTFNIVKPEGSDTDVYTLKETKAPEGYDKITTTWKVLVSSEGVTMVKDIEGNEIPKYPDVTYVVSSAKTDEADSTEQTAKTPSVIREYKSDDVNVTVTAENEADLPADAKLVVKPIELSQKAQENVEQAAIKEEKKAIKNILAYDIHFEADGKEVQPGATVKVSVDVPEIKAGANASVFHVDDKNKVENMDGDVDKKGNVVFETTHFSLYAIVNYWDNYLIYNPKVAQLPAPDHQKYIQSNGNDQYKLTLDVTGKVGEADPIDILLIVDKSGSMEGSGVTNVNAAISTLTHTLTEAKIRAQVKLAVVTFSGMDSRYGYDSPWNDADCAQDWIDLNNFNWSLNNPTGGTNWQAGIKKGEEVLQSGSGTKKYVVFLTDGTPTFRYNSSGYTEGNGSNDSSGYNYNAAITEWNKSSTLKAATGKYVIDATSKGSTNCEKLAQTLSGNYLIGNNTNSITDSFKKIANAIAYPSYNNVTITDTLSDYAEFKDAKGRPVIQVYKGHKTYTKDASGTITGIQSVTEKTSLAEGTDYEYTYDPSTKTVTVKLNGDLKNGELKNGELEQDITYWIEFDIKPT